MVIKGMGDHYVLCFHASPAISPVNFFADTKVYYTRQWIKVPCACVCVCVYIYIYVCMYACKKSCIHRLKILLEFGGLWKHKNYPACTKSVWVFIMLKKKKCIKLIIIFCLYGSTFPHTSDSSALILVIFGSTLFVSQIWPACFWRIMIIWLSSST